MIHPEIQAVLEGRSRWCVVTAAAIKEVGK